MPYNTVCKKRRKKKLVVGLLVPTDPQRATDVKHKRAFPVKPTLSGSGYLQVRFGLPEFTKADISCSLLLGDQC